MINVAPIWLPELQQKNYRALLEAMARPGTCQLLEFSNALNNSDTNEKANIALLASLVDQSVTLSDPHGMINQDELVLLQAKSASPRQADFILVSGNQSPEFEPKLGSLPSPELSATIVLHVENIFDDHQGNLKLKLLGPGVNGEQLCSINGLNSDWLIARQNWVCSFPLGVDFFLVDDDSVMALPRTTKVEQV